MCTVPVNVVCLTSPGRFPCQPRLRPLNPRRILRTRATSTEASVEVQEAEEALRKVATRPIGHIVDEVSILKDSTFPIAPDRLITLAKDALKDPYDSITTNAEFVDEENFVFKAPVIGPLNYEQFASAVKGFSLQDVFPGHQQCMHNFWVDPYEPNRVWYTQRFYGKHGGPIFGKPATGKIVDGTPCMHSLVFNEEGKIIKCTVGYPMDRDIGNTGGLGGMFGPLWAIGAALPFPEARPYQASWQIKFFGVINQISRFFSKKK